MQNDNLNSEQFERERIERERREKEEKERLERLEREHILKERMEKQKMENKLYPNNMLFIIPSWGDLLGHPTLGTYVHHKVSQIDTDLVIFLSGFDYSIETPKGTLYYLFGLGFHFLKFEIESGNYITDFRTLTGLVLSDFVYDHMASSNSVTLKDDRDVVIAEKVIRIPIDLSHKSENHITFIKGTLMRNIFIPHKDVFLNFIEHIRDAETYQISTRGHMLMSTHWDFYDKIMVSEKMRENPYKSYLDSAAGLNDIAFGSDQLLQETVSPINLSIIEGNIEQLKSIYSNVDFDPMYLYSLIEGASTTLRSDGPGIPTTPGTTPKQSIFSSASDRMDAYVSWPTQFTRKAKKIPPPAIPKTVPRQHEQQNARTEVEITKMPEHKQEEFILRTQKSEEVEFKPLPNHPAIDIKSIMSYMNNVIGGHYNMRSIGQAFEIARDSMRQMSLSSSSTLQKRIWELSKYANIYQKKDPNLGLPLNEKLELLEKLNNWLSEIAEEDIKEIERLERIRLEKERREKEEKERSERDRRAAENLKREQAERERLEKEQQLLDEKRREIAKINEIKEEQERAQQARARLELEQKEKAQLEEIERKKQETMKIQKERLMKEKEELEALEREKQEYERLKRERKVKEKEVKQQAKKDKKIKKQRDKIEKKKQKEQAKLSKL